MVATGCDDASTTAAVQDALWGSIAITTRSGVFDIADTYVSSPLDSGWKARRAHQLSGLQPSLQPLHAGRTDPRRKPSRSQPTRSWATGMGRAISNRCSVIMAADRNHLPPITQVGMGAS